MAPEPFETNISFRKLKNNIFRYSLSFLSNHGKKNEKKNLFKFCIAGTSVLIEGSEKQDVEA